MKKGVAILCAGLLLSAAGCAKAPAGASTAIPTGASAGTSAAHTAQPAESIVETVPYDSSYLEYFKQGNEKILARASRKDKSLLLTGTTPEEPLCRQYLVECFNIYVSHQPAELIGFDEAFPVQCLRRIDEERLYTIHKTDGGAWFYAFFFASGPQWLLSHTVVAEKSLYSKDFLTVKAGTTLEAVGRIDPAAARYQKLCTELPIPAGERVYSIHLLRDGVIRLWLEKQADGSLVVTEKEYYADFKIPTGFERVLLYYDCTILEEDYPS